MTIYAFEYCSCVFESAFGIESLHTTKRGAWKAMNKWLNNRFIKEYDFRIKYGKNLGCIYKRGNIKTEEQRLYLMQEIDNWWRLIYVHQAWRVRAVEVEEMDKEIERIRYESFCEGVVSNDSGEK